MHTQSDVYVTHDQVEAMTMGDRVAVLRNGKLQQFASPSDFYDRPENAFVAGFIGSPAMNLMTLPITSDGVRVGENSTLELERDQMRQLHEAGLKEVTVGIRPEQLELSDSGKRRRCAWFPFCQRPHGKETCHRQQDHPRHRRIQRPRPFERRNARPCQTPYAAAGPVRRPTHPN